MPVSVSSANRPKKIKSRENADVRSLFWAFLIILAVVGLDQVTKFWAVQNLSGQPSMHVIGDFFMLTLVYNEGGAMGTRLGSANYYLVAALFILTLIFVYIWQNRTHKTLTLPLSLIAGGAIGNIIDRFRLGKVVDFVDIDIPNIHIGSFHLERWWTFNIADAAISCSIVFLLAYMLFYHERSDAPAESEIPANTHTDSAVQ